MNNKPGIKERISDGTYAAIGVIAIALVIAAIVLLFVTSANSEKSNGTEAGSTSAAQVSSDSSSSDSSSSDSSSSDSSDSDSSSSDSSDSDSDNASKSDDELALDAANAYCAERVKKHDTISDITYNDKFTETNGVYQFEFTVKYSNDAGDKKAEVTVEKDENGKYAGKHLTIISDDE